MFLKTLHLVCVIIYGLKQERGEGVNCLRRIFANFEGIMKANEESQRKKLRKEMHKVVLVYFQKINRLFLRFNWLFLSAVNKNNLKQIYERSRKERITQTDLYWFTLTPKATSSPQKPLGIPLCNQNQITNTTHQSNDLDPLKKHTTFGKSHQECWFWTPQEHTTLSDNTNTEIQEGNRIHLGITKLKVQNYNPILFNTLKNDPKLFQILENCFDKLFFLLQDYA